MWLVHGDDLTNDDDDLAEDDIVEKNSGKISPEDMADKQKEEQEASSESDSDKRSGVLRGAAYKGYKSPGKQFDKQDLGGIFQGLLQTLSDGNDGLVSEQAKDVALLNDLIDRIFPPRLQTTPKYQGSLECLNEALHRDTLSGPNKNKRDSKSLQQAYNFLRGPPRMLQVPSLFVELREAADKSRWDSERADHRKRYEIRGDPVPERFLLTAEELVVRDAEEPRSREEELSDEEVKSRLRVLNGWLKQQFRLRLYYLKRIGSLEGHPQDLLVTFEAGPDRIAVTVEDIEGLSYNGQLDPEPIIEASGSEEVLGAQESEL